VTFNLTPNTLLPISELEHTITDGILFCLPRPAGPKKKKKNKKARRHGAGFLVRQWPGSVQRGVRRTCLALLLRRPAVRCRQNPSLIMAHSPFGDRRETAAVRSWANRRPEPEDYNWFGPAFPQESIVVGDISVFSSTRSAARPCPKLLLRSCLHLIGLMPTGGADTSGGRSSRPGQLQRLPPRRSFLVMSDGAFDRSADLLDRGLVSLPSRLAIWRSHHNS